MYVNGKSVVTKSEAELRADYVKLMAKIDKLAEARRIAEKAWMKMEEDKANWDAMMNLHGHSGWCDMGDFLA